MAINIVVSGPRGKVGTAAINMIQAEPTFHLVACIDYKHDGKRLKDITDFDLDVPVYGDPDDCFKSEKVDVLLDLTVPEAGFTLPTSDLEYGVREVSGTSGYTQAHIQKFEMIATQKQIGCIIAPNFAIGAILMMHFAKIAAKFFPDVEIIEKHHDQKLDAPSGTAVKTAELIQEVRTAKHQGHEHEEETLAGARGGNVDGMRIHSVRLPGLVAHQEVIFGGPGQILTIKHDSMNRDSFMEGVKTTIKHVMTINHFIYGLENMLDLS